MKKLARLVLWLIACRFALLGVANAQVSHIDSLKLTVAKQPDTLKVMTMLNIGSAYNDKNVYDTALSYYINALKLAENTYNKQPLFECLLGLAYFYEERDNYGLALEFALRAKTIAEQGANKQNLYSIYSFTGLLYFNEGVYDTSLIYCLKLVNTAQQLEDKSQLADAWLAVGDVYREQNKFDKAAAIYDSALQLTKNINYAAGVINAYNDIALLNENQGHTAAAIPFFLQAIATAEKHHYNNPVITDNIIRGYIDEKKYDSALYFSKKLLQFSQRENSKEFLVKAYYNLQSIYAAQQNYGQAYGYLHSYLLLKDSLNSTEQQNKMDFLEAEYKTGRQQKQIDLLQKNNQLQGLLRNVLIAAAILLLVTAFLLANRYRHKKKAEAALSLKNSELQNTLYDLKATQAQLIQSEKMASLGELTAGIAHEIQNPLNFVNNFSEVSVELAEEIKEEFDKKGMASEAGAELKEMLDDLIKNQQKINFHGKRADSIVKNMLQHSRKTAGHKEPVDINALAEEYLRLSYHGLRAKDKSFNATLETRFDESLPMVPVVIQDIGRVLLNIFTNAFYSVMQKAKTAGGLYQAVVAVSTKRAGNMLEIRVRDNGTGIAQAALGKIYNPFFTTKPTGEGTGLGLSLSYDIITKGHGGGIEAITKEGEFAEFVILLPLH